MRNGFFFLFPARVIKSLWFYRRGRKAHGDKFWIFSAVSAACPELVEGFSAVK
jgi:hypothetical protein